MTVTEPLTPGTTPPASSTDVDLSQINLAGYELQTLLGSGGYGEVWKAIGPGGFAKAVKVLYGRSDGEQAESELKALERMRQLRHPFLLNIERVELCNNRLIVVTELADGNLNERFLECVEQGRIGIPRDELISYLRDAADALDFMSQEHGLQHLDIKPDNLLLQGKHAKLGDFGLAKDISRPGMSMINGFTPLYASPELFEGRPGPTSDQYSLAIVFHAMLTGQPPFNGRNAAQLTSQHLRSQPDLSALPPADRPVIARGLSKTASARFPSCRDLVDELTSRSHRAVRQSSVRVTSTTSEEPSMDLSGDTETLQSGQRPEKLDSIPLTTDNSADQAFTPRPTLFIGVGGLAGGVLRQLKRIWHQHSDVAIPIWQVLAIDTDIDSLRAVDGLPQQAQLGNAETLPIRLRSSADYRKSSQLDLSWLSRRWLFNIPRSTRVEGMRPLARLAVQDHLDDLKTRLRDRIHAATETQAVADSSVLLGTEVTGEDLTVVIVAGTAGGTGSGAVIDVGLIVQQLKSEFPNLNVNVQGMLVQSSGRQQKVDGIHCANSIACLKELSAQSGSQVTIPRGFSKETANLQPFDHTWLLHAGDELVKTDLDQLKQNLAQFLYNTSGTIAAGIWLAPSSESTGSENSWNLLGLSAVDRDVYSTAEAEAASLSMALMDQWLKQCEFDGSSGNAPVGISGVDCANELLTGLKLTPETVPQRILQELRGTSGRCIEQLAELMFRQLEDSVPPESTQSELSERLQQLAQNAGQALLTQLEQNVSQVVAQEQLAASSQIERLLVELTESAGVEQKQQAAIRIRSQIRSARDCCHQLRHEIEQAFRALLSVPSTPNGASVKPSDRRELCRQFCVLNGSRVIYDAFQDSLSQLEQSVERLSTELLGAKERLTQLCGILSARYITHAGIPEPVVESFRESIAGDVLLSFSSVMNAQYDAEEIVGRLIDRATGFLLSAGSPQPPAQRSFPNNVWPRFHGNGGRHRVLTWKADPSSHSHWQSRLAAEFGDCVRVFEANSTRVSAACEIMDVESRRILDAMQLENRTAWTMAGRIHSRVDVNW